MKKVIIRRKEVLNHLPKEIRAGAKVTIGSIYVGRQPLKGVEGEEAQKLLKDIIDVPSNHQDWPKKEKDFWASMRVKVPFEGVELDISTDEDGNPFNPMNYLIYKWCMKHRLVASTKEEMEADGRKQAFFAEEPTFKDVSMGMSHDYEIALRNGTTLVRVGTKLFGERVY